MTCQVVLLSITILDARAVSTHTLFIAVVHPVSMMIVLSNIFFGKLRTLRITRREAHSQSHRRLLLGSQMAGTSLAGPQQAHSSYHD